MDLKGVFVAITLKGFQENRLAPGVHSQGAEPLDQPSPHGFGVCALGYGELALSQ